MEAVSDYDIYDSAAWQELDALSANTHVEQIEVIPEGIFETADGFLATGTIYVTLHYGSGNEAIAVSESFPIEAAGDFEKRGRKITATIKEFLVDTSSFHK